jgi:transcriptional regulator of arginine metabolism
MDAPLSDRFKKILKETIQSIDAAENLIVIKTLSGCANAAGEAIDTSDYPEIVGTLAGDNTLLVIVDKKEHVPHVLTAFENIIA